MHPHHVATIPSPAFRRVCVVSMHQSYLSGLGGPMGATFRTVGHRGARNGVGGQVDGAQLTVPRSGDSALLLAEMNVPLGERNRAAGRLQALLQLLGEVEVHGPVIVRYTPRAHDQIDRGIAEV